MLTGMETTARDRRGRGGGAADPAGPRGSGGIGRMSTGQSLAMGALLLFLVVTLAMPLRTFAEQRAELAAIQENIARMEQRREALQAERDRYSDPEYVKEQARIRLGLVEEGETPFRIIDPALGAGDPNAPGTGDGPTAPQAPWYGRLWASISEPPPEPEPENPAREEATRPDRLPVVPAPEPDPGLGEGDVPPEGTGQGAAPN